MLRKLNSIFQFLLRKQVWERELDAELRYHFERQIEEDIRRGMSLEEARRTARRNIGGVEQIKEECREARLGRLVETTLQDIRHGVRVLFKNPGFACTAIGTLALGIGVNTAIFSLVYGILLRPLPYRQGGQLVVLHQNATRAHVSDIPFSAKEIFDYRDGNSTLANVVEHHSMVFLLLGKDWAERVQTAVVSANFFDVLGVSPLLGRTFRASDDTPKADAVLILSYNYWKTRHGGDPNIVGKVFQMNNRPHTVIGVLPPFPQYPAEADVYMPTSACPFRSSKQALTNRRFRMMTAFGRLKPGVSLKQAQADLSTIAARLGQAYPEFYPKGYGYELVADPLQDDLTRRARSTFLVLLGASGLILLIACANVANLLLARLVKLERELAVRTALGAGRLRLMRQLLTESVLLALAGGVLGVAAAPLVLNLLVKFAERFTTRASEVKLDAPVLLFALFVSIATGILFGLAPAFSSAMGVAGILKQGFSRMTATRARQRFRRLLVVAQVAVSFMLLIGAGLLIRSFLKLQQVNPGFNPDRLLVLRVSPSFSKYNAEGQILLSHKILRRVRELSAVQSAALASNFPFNPNGIASGPGSNEFEIEGRGIPKGELMPQADITAVSPLYFETIRQPLVRGRVFCDRDDAKAPYVAIINESMTRHRWPAEDPIGKRITLDHGAHWLTIVGIVGDVREYGLDRRPGDEVYLPMDQAGLGGSLIVRTALDPMTIAPWIRSALHDVDSQLAVDLVHSMEHFEYESVALPRLTAMLLGIFAALAVLISASGVAAVIALAVAERTHELGIRMALGAKRNSVLAMVLRQGIALTVTGVVAGSAGAIVLTRLLSSLLFATSPTDPGTYSAVLVLFLAIAVVACLIPARQVTSIDPVIALRNE